MVLLLSGGANRYGLSIPQFHEAIHVEPIVRLRAVGF